MTAAERSTLGDIFSSVRWETTADTETCPLWDPAFIDSFRWDAVEISTNLCQAPYLGFEQSQAITEGLFPLVLIDTTP